MTDSEAGARKLKSLNAASPADAETMLHGLVENAPWLTARLAQARPFASVEAMAEALATTLRAASESEKLKLLLGHPELAGQEAMSNTMTPESTSEQGRLGLTAMSGEDLRILQARNAAYSKRFGFPFIVALRAHADMASVYRNYAARFSNSTADEMACSIEEVIKVSRGRLTRFLEA